MLGTRVLVHVPNSGLPSYGGCSQWMIAGFKQGDVLPLSVRASERHRASSEDHAAGTVRGADA